MSQSIKNDVQAKLRRYQDWEDRKCLVEVVEIIFENAVSQPELIPQLIVICKTNVSDDFITKFSEKAESSLRRIQSSEGRNMMSDEDRNIIQLIGQLFINNLISIDTIKRFIHNLLQSIQDPTKWSSANESHVQLGIVLIRNIGCVIDISENGPIYYWFGILEHVEPFLGSKTREMITDLLKLRNNGWNREMEIDEKNAKIIELQKEVGNYKMRVLTEQQRQMQRNDGGGIQELRKIKEELENQVSLLNDQLRAEKTEFENLKQINEILNSNNEELFETLKKSDAENKELQMIIENIKCEVSSLNDKLRDEKTELEDLKHFNEILLFNNNEELVERLKKSDAENKELQMIIENIKYEVQNQMKYSENRAVNNIWDKIEKLEEHHKEMRFRREVQVEEEVEVEEYTQPSTSNLCMSHQLQNRVRQMQNGQISDEDAVLLSNLILKLAHQ